VLPHPSLVILGVSPVALSLATQARQLGYHVTVAAPSGDLPNTPDADMLIDGYALGGLHQARRVHRWCRRRARATKPRCGRGRDDAAYHAFVGSRRKMAALREKLITEGIDASAIRPHQGAGRSRSRRHHAGGNRDVDPGRDHQLAPARQRNPLPP